MIGEIISTICFLTLEFIELAICRVVGFLFGYPPAVTGTSSKHSSHVDHATGEVVHCDTITRYTTYTNRFGKERNVKQTLPPVITRTKIGERHFCPSFAEAMEMANIKPDETDE